MTVQNGNQVDVTGGVFSGTIVVDLPNSYLDFFGSDFAYNAQTGLLTGTLQDGDSINVLMSSPYVGPLAYSISSSLSEITFTDIVVASVPEPSSVVTLTIGLLGLAGAQAYRSRRRLDRGQDSDGRPRT